MSLLNHNQPINIQQIKSMYNMFQQAQNPQAMLSNIAAQNPQFADVLNMCNSKDPREVFYAMCQQRGINPNDILNQLK